MVTPQLLATSYLVHLIATVVWIGGIVFMALVVTPVAGSEPGCSRFLTAIQRRFTPIANLCLAALIVTGMVQLTANTNYVGFLNFSNLWAKAVLLKHVAVGGMIATALYMSLVLQPDINRTAMLLAAGRATPEETGALARRQSQLAQINVVLAMVVLLFTAIARAQ
jgi:putative copper resistance protein D